MGRLTWILLIEDVPDHRLLVRESLARVTALPLTEVATGSEAYAFMERLSGSGAENEGMVILDLGLRGYSGFEVLEYMREDPALADVAVTVLTASQNPMDAEHAFSLGVKGYFQKPTDFGEYVEIFRRLFVAAPSDNGGPPQ